MDEAFEEMWNDAMGIDMSEPKVHRHDWHQAEYYSQTLGCVVAYMKCATCPLEMSIDEYLMREELA